MTILKKKNIKTNMQFHPRKPGKQRKLNVASTGKHIIKIRKGVKQIKIKRKKINKSRCWFFQMSINLINQATCIREDINK